MAELKATNLLLFNSTCDATEASAVPSEDILQRNFMENKNKNWT